MGTLNSLLALVNSALVNDQNALNVTANNVANQNTPGYTRETVNWQTADSITIGNVSYGQGSTESISSARDRVLEQRVQQQTQAAGQSDALETALTQIQDIFTLSSTDTSAASTTLGTDLNSFFNSFSALEANPSDLSTRQSVLTAATTLASDFNSTSQQLSSEKNALDNQATNLVGQVNTLTSQIATLNQQIAANSPDRDAGVLEDQRQAAIAQLSQLIGVDQITTEQNGITLTTSSGAVLVSGGQSYALETSESGGVAHILAGPDHADVTSSLTGGTLGGVLAARDQQIPGILSGLDTLAYDLGTSVNQQNEAGLDGNGNPGQAIFTLPATASGAAADIAVATTDPQSIAAAAVGEGSAGNSNATALADLANSDTVSGQTPSGFYAAFLAQIGDAASAATTDNGTQQAALTQLTAQRDALSSVSLDQEASDLTQYQRSYQAASQVFTILDQLMASALNLGVETAVS